MIYRLPFILIVFFGSIARAEEPQILVKSALVRSEDYEAFLLSDSHFLSPVEFQLSELEKNLSFSLKWAPILKESELLGEGLSKNCSSALGELYLQAIQPQDLETLEICSSSFAKSKIPSEKNFFDKEQILKAQANLHDRSSSFQKIKKDLLLWDVKKDFPEYEMVLINGYMFKLEDLAQISLIDSQYQIILFSNSHTKIEHFGTIKELRGKKNLSVALLRGSCVNPEAGPIPLTYIHRSFGYYGSECAVKLIGESVVGQIETPTPLPQIEESSTKWWLPVGILVGVGTLLYLSDKDVSISMPF